MAVLARVGVNIWIPVE